MSEKYYTLSLYDFLVAFLIRIPVKTRELIICVVDLLNFQIPLYDYFRFWNIIEFSEEIFLQQYRRF